MSTESAPLKFRCPSCGRDTPQIRFISAVGNVCHPCHTKLAVLGRFVEYAERLRCDPDDEHSVRTFRCAVRALQKLGQMYMIVDSDDGTRGIEVIEDTSRRKLVLKAFMEQQSSIQTLLWEYEQPSRHSPRGAPCTPTSPTTPGT